jgi:hypothetical protein
MGGGTAGRTDLAALVHALPLRRLSVSAPPS